jgi:1-acyl-sn-glycerol-3-phosphate acyltransferase
MYYLCKFLSFVFIKFFYGHRVYGQEHIPPGGAVVAANHTSFIDPPLVGSSCRGSLHYLARGSLFNAPVIGWLIRQLHTHPVEKGAGNLQTIKLTLDLLQQGHKVLLFPEGSRSVDGTLQPGNLGIGLIVQRARCPVIPVYIHGTFAIWNKERKFPKLRGHTACIFGSPIPYEEHEQKKVGQEKIVSKIMERIAGLRDWYQAGAVGTPP